MQMARLCVNIDHIATLREARKATMPDTVEAARICERAGAIGITIHLREDRRHIHDHDLVRLRPVVQGLFNLEMAPTDEMVGIALQYKPHQTTLVPEKRMEVTTEGGLDVASQEQRMKSVVDRLQGAGIDVSMFIDPDRKQIEASARVGAKLIELHTGTYCDAENTEDRERNLRDLVESSAFARSLGLLVNAGHGLDTSNVRPVAAIPGMQDLNIGYSIICRALFVGLDAAVREMIDCIADGTANSDSLAR
jgi:pyridoxine 5-phosphate synthase